MNSSLIFKINNENLKNNVEALKKELNKYNNLLIKIPKDREVLINNFYENGITKFVTIDLDSAIKSRHYNRKADIICYEKVNEDYIYDCINSNIVVRIFALSDLINIENLNIKDDLNLELLISTGMGSTGLKNKTEINEALKIIADNKHLKLYSVTTDIINQEIDLPFFDFQVTKLKELIPKLDALVYLNEVSYFYKKLSYCNAILLENIIYKSPEESSKLFAKLKFNYNIYKNKLEKKLINRKIITKNVCYYESYILDVFENSLEFKTPKNYQVGILPFGLDHIKQFKIYLNDELIPILKVASSYTFIKISKEIKVKNRVIIIPKY